MLTTQRTEAHTTVARALEAKLGMEPASLPLILQHWRAADVTEGVMSYLDQVAELKLRQYDNVAAIALIQELLALAEQNEQPLDRQREAKCQLILADAAKSAGQMELSRRSYEKGLALLGMPVPAGPPGLAFSLVREALMQIRSRLFPPDLPLVSNTATTVDRENFIAAARAHDALTQIYYFAGEKKRLLHATLRATNLAERFHELSPTLAISYASLGAICGVIPLRRDAGRYLLLASHVASQFDDPVASIHVHLLAGLYATAVGHWSKARDEFAAGVDLSLALGDMRKWSELAVGLETISGPWLLTGSFLGIDEWHALILRICESGRERGDFQVLACGLLGAVRGYRVLRRFEGEEVEQLAELVGHHSAELELIHCVEAAGLLASAAREQGDVDLYASWLQRAQEFLDDVNPGMKSRTLPALVAVFDACIDWRTDHVQPGAATEQQLAIGRGVVKKLEHFARIYPIGRPAALRSQGDLHWVHGRRNKTLKRWERSLRSAVALRMPRDAVAAQERLEALGGSSQALTAELEAMLKADDSGWLAVIGRP